MKIKRRKSKVVNIGGVKIGSSNPIVIQSMTKTQTSSVEQTVNQIKGLKGAGCEVVRLAVRDAADARALKKIKERIDIPLVADIHFDWRLAIQAIESGVDKIRLNPGNIFKKEDVLQVAHAAKMHHIPIRVGVNSGSLRSRHSDPETMVESALNYIKILEGCKFYDIVISLKASNILDTVDAYRKISQRCDYPLHLGVTATGSPYAGALKSSVALGILLEEGIGDTLRISLTDTPKQEVLAAKIILESLGLRSFGHELISCPTCGRCEVDLVRIVKQLESKLSTKNYQLKTRPLKVAVMGCVVNGPGEAKEADLGLAFGKKSGLLFKKGKAIRKVSYADCSAALLKELRS